MKYRGEAVSKKSGGIAKIMAAAGWRIGVT